MDEIVKQALAKWPNVPACTGWLGLDARGQWWMRDAVCQARGSFQAGCAAGDVATKGSLLKHDKLIAFIQRNYGVDAQGYIDYDAMRALALRLPKSMWPVPPAYGHVFAFDDNGRVLDGRTWDGMPNYSARPIPV